MKRSLQFPLPECQSIAVHRSLLSRASGDVIERLGPESSFRLFLQQAGVGRDAGQDAREGTLAVDFGLITAVILRHGWSVEEKK